MTRPPSPQQMGSPMRPPSRLLNPDAGPNNSLTVQANLCSRWSSGGGQFNCDPSFFKLCSLTYWSPTAAVMNYTNIMA